MMNIDPHTDPDFHAFASGFRDRVITD